jgi:competence protein ComEC
MLLGRGEPPDAGSVMTGRLELWIPPVAAIPGGFDYRGFLAGRGLLWQGKVHELRVVENSGLVTEIFRRILVPLRRGIVARIQELLPAREADLAAAVLLGRRTEGSRESSRPFANLGLAHLFSVSGLHVGILLGIFLLPAVLANASRPWRVIPLAVILPVYVLLTGIPGSVVRASGLGFLALAAGLFGRRADPLYLVGLLFWLGSLWDPIQNLDPGLRLSYLAAGGILTVSRRLEQGKIMGEGWTRRVGSGLSVSLAAQWFTLNQVAVSFGRISLLSTPANLVAVPLFGVALWATVLALVLSVVLPWGAQALAACAWLIMRSMSAAVSWASAATGGFSQGLAVPGPGKVLIHALLSWGLVFLVGTGNRLLVPGLFVRRCSVVLLLGLGFLVVAPWGHDLRRVSGPTVWQFDVGQGDCSWIVFPDGWNCLVDTGGKFGFKATAEGPLSRNLRPLLERSGVGHLDAVIVTHDHLDHTGGVSALAQGFRVGKFYCGGESAKIVQHWFPNGAVVDPVAGDVIHQWREWAITVLYPIDVDHEDLSENNQSVVLGLRRNDRYVLVLSGDLEVEGEALWAESGSVPANVQVWKSGHHGSNTSGSREFLERTNPSLILISCGVGNRYSHPSHGPYVAGGDTLPVWRTDLSGTLRLQWDEYGRLSYGTGTGRFLRVP